MSSALTNRICWRAGMRYFRASSEKHCATLPTAARPLSAGASNNAVSADIVSSYITPAVIITQKGFSEAATEQTRRQKEGRFATSDPSASHRARFPRQAARCPFCCNLFTPKAVEELLLSQGRFEGELTSTTV